MTQYEQEKPCVLVATLNENLLVQNALPSDSFELFCVSSAREALAYLRTDTPNLMILDGHLPDMRGTILCDRAKRVKRLSTVPVIVLANQHDQNMLADAKMSMADRHMTKPLMARRLRKMVIDLLGSRYLYLHERDDEYLFED